MISVQIDKFGHLLESNGSVWKLSIENAKRLARTITTDVVLKHESDHRLKQLIRERRTK